MWEPFLMTPTSTKRKIGIGISYFLDIIICISALTWISLVEFGVTPHFQQGFFCNDTSISYKYKGDTVNVACLVISGFVPLIIMWITEFIKLHYSSNSNSLRIDSKTAALECSGYAKHYAIGLLTKLAIVEAVKGFLGELRPHFLHTCKPDALKDCSTGSNYIQKYSCTGYTEFGTVLVTDSSRSFPSGHSSVSFFEAIFLIWYLQERFPKCQSALLLPFIQCLCIMWACFCSVSRITDYRHHWWDVLAGSILGTIFAIIMCTVFCKGFKNFKPLPIEIPTQNGSVTTTNNHHTSIKRLISDSSIKEEVTLNNIAAVV